MEWELALLLELAAAQVAVKAGSLLSLRVGQYPLKREPVGQNVEVSCASQFCFRQRMNLYLRSNQGSSQAIVPTEPEFFDLQFLLQRPNAFSFLIASFCQAAY